VTRENARSAPAKAQLRARILGARAARSAQSLAHARAAIAALAIAGAGSAGRTIAAYQPLRTEPGSPELLDGLVRAGARVLVPVLLADGDLSWSSWPAMDLLGVSAIGDVDLIFVPALAVDGAGRRLGRGGGSYDRALTRVAEGVPIVALVFDDEILERVPVDEWDRPVTAALTPTGWIDFDADE
jgi:5-formyltetrahydrofolate cyclo-ligase